MKKKMLVAVEGMKFHAPHGFYEEEAIIGNVFLVDVYVTTNFSTAGETDNLAQTVNYEVIYQTAKDVFAKRVKLLETLGEGIVTKLKTTYPLIQSIKVRISKLNPPFGGDVQRSFIEVEYDYETV